MPCALISCWHWHSSRKLFVAKASAATWQGWAIWSGKEQSHVESHQMQAPCVKDTEAGSGEWDESRVRRGDEVGKLEWRPSLSLYIRQRSMPWCTICHVKEIDDEVWLSPIPTYKLFATQWSRRQDQVLGVEHRLLYKVACQKHVSPASLLLLLALWPRSLEHCCHFNTTKQVNQV